MAKENKAAEREMTLERCTVPVELYRVSGSFKKENGEVIDYVKYVVSVDGADLDISLDKGAKSLMDRYVPFEEVSEGA